MTATLTWYPELASTELCDRCGAGAKLRVVFPTGYDLLFCGHHARRYARELAQLDVVLQRSP